MDSNGSRPEDSGGSRYPQRPSRDKRDAVKRAAASSQRCLFSGVVGSLLRTPLEKQSYGSTVPVNPNTWRATCQALWLKRLRSGSPCCLRVPPDRLASVVRAFAGNAWTSAHNRLAGPASRTFDNMLVRPCRGGQGERSSAVAYTRLERPGLRGHPHGTRPVCAVNRSGLGAGVPCSLRTRVCVSD